MLLPVSQQSRFLLSNVFCTSTKLSLPRRFARISSRSFSYPGKFSFAANMKKPEQHTSDMAKVETLKHKLELQGITLDDSCAPGLYSCVFCPKCKGGQSMSRSLSIHVNQYGDFAMWRCFEPSCGFAGQAFAKGDASRLSESCAGITEESLGLKPLGPKLIAYFGDRGISEETLRKNFVLQKFDDQAVIAFTYRLKGKLVGCKYRTEGKRFWQEKGTERWLYGLDGISKSSDIIIVEGEIDKLSVEEIGLNCVSVPAGAPRKVSAKEVPTSEKDIAFQYLWNNKEYLDKASRIILATDCDKPGNALAEELARRLGKERCWHVCWPKKDESTYFKDPNEVLVELGPSALREVIENAESYPLP